jgi:hypothetical protein
MDAGSVRCRTNSYVPDLPVVFLGVLTAAAPPSSSHALNASTCCVTSSFFLPGMVGGETTAAARLSSDAGAKVSCTAIFSASVAAVT